MKHQLFPVIHYVFICIYIYIHIIFTLHHRHISPWTHDLPTRKATATAPGLLLADSEIQKNGLHLPGFDPLTYEATVFRPHGTGVRRLEMEMQQESTEEEQAEAEKKWDPENHPSDLDPRLFFFKFFFGGDGILGHDLEGIQGIQESKS